MDMVNITVNGTPMSVPAGSTILEACRQMGYEIPTLCYMKEKNEIGACRICVVEVKGARSLVSACVFPVNEGMEVFTNSKRVRDSRKTTLELILSTHNRKCLSCVRSGSCELQQLCNEYGVTEYPFDGGAKKETKIDDLLPLMSKNRQTIAIVQDKFGGTFGLVTVEDIELDNFDKEKVVRIDYESAWSPCIEEFDELQALSGNNLSTLEELRAYYALQYAKKLYVLDYLTDDAIFDIAVSDLKIVDKFIKSAIEYLDESLKLSDDALKTAEAALYELSNNTKKEMLDFVNAEYEEVKTKSLAHFQNTLVNETQKENLYNKAIAKVMEAHPNWELEQYKMFEIE